MNETALKVSVCTPAHNEEANVERLIERVDDVLRPLCGNTWEHLIVDDGSSDRTAELIRRSEKEHPQVRLLRHEKNRGECAAWKTAFDAARGEVIVMLACDLQSHPEDIPLLLAQVWEHGYDVGTGARSARKDGWYYWAATRVLTTYMHYAFDVEITDVSSSFFAARSQFLKNAPLRLNDHRYIMAVMRHRSARIREVQTRHSPRTAGSSHYSRWKVLKAIPEVLRFTARLYSGELDGQASGRTR
jgi:dolichol-phosphate mannosyltransferase